MTELLVSERALREEVAASAGRINVEIRGAKAMVEFRQLIIDPANGLALADAVVSSVGVRHFGGRVHFDLPLQTLVRGAPSDEDAHALELTFTEWLTLLAAAGP